MTKKAPTPIPNQFAIPAGEARAVRRALDAQVGTPKAPIPIPNEDAIPAGEAGEIYRALWAQTKHPSKRRNLAHIWSALQTLTKKKTKQFTVAVVLVALHEAKVRIAESSIRNKQGKDYQALIAAYDAQFGTQDAAAPDSDAFVHGIEDQRVALRVRQLMVENKSLKFRNDILHADFQRLTAEISASSPATKSASVSPALPLLDSGVAPRGVEAVRKFLDGVEERGWHIDEPTGALLDRRMAEIAGPGFVFALRQIVGR